MGTSIQMVGQNVAILEDGDLLILLGMMLEEMEEGRYQKLNGFAKQWRYTIGNYGPGTLDMKLEELSKDDEAKAQILELMVAIQERFLKHTDVLSAEEIRSRWRVRGVRFYDYRTSGLLSALAKLRSLVEMLQ